MKKDKAAEVKSITDEQAESRLENCDCCHDTFSQDDLVWTGNQMLCLKCRKESPTPSDAKAGRYSITGTGYVLTLRDNGEVAAEIWNSSIKPDFIQTILDALNKKAELEALLQSLKPYLRHKYEHCCTDSHMLCDCGLKQFTALLKDHNL